MERVFYLNVFEPRMNTNGHEYPLGIALGFSSQDCKIDKIAPRGKFNLVNLVILAQKMCVHLCSFVVQKPLKQECGASKGLVNKRSFASWIYF